MLQMTISMVGENDPPPLENRNVVHIEDGRATVYCIDKGMASGKPSAAFHLELPEGGGVLFQTSARLFVLAARAIEARHPDLFND